MDAFLHALRGFFQNLQFGVLPALDGWNYVLLAILVAVEGPVTTLLGAAAASSGVLQPKLVFLSASLGNLTADFLWYTLGYMGKIEWLERYGGWMGIRQEILDRLKRMMVRHGTKILLVAKLTAGFIIPSLIAAGLARLPFRRWLPVIAVGEMIWTGSLVLIGYYTTVAIYRFAHDLEYIMVAASIIFLVVIIALIHKVIHPEFDEDEANNDNEREGI